MAWRGTLAIAKSDLGGDEREGREDEEDAIVLSFLCAVSFVTAFLVRRKGGRGVYFLGLLITVQYIPVDDKLLQIVVKALI